MEKYAKAKGINLEGITSEEKMAVKKDMIMSLYPGQVTITVTIYRIFISRYNMRDPIFEGLKASPYALKDTMLPNISPELVAATAVQISGGYDPQRFGVSIFPFSSYHG